MYSNSQNITVSDLVCKSNIRYTSPSFTLNCSDAKADTISYIPVEFLSEDAIDEALTKIKDTSEEVLERYQIYNFTSLIKGIISAKHFSEDFLLKWYPNLDLTTILKQHSDDIISNRYSRLNLMIETEN